MYARSFLRQPQIARKILKFVLSFSYSWNPITELFYALLQL